MNTKTLCSIESVKEDKERWDMDYAYVLIVRGKKRRNYYSLQYSGKQMMQLIDSISNRKDLQTEIYYNPAILFHGWNGRFPYRTIK